MDEYTSASGKLVRLVAGRVASAGAASFRETFAEAIADFPVGAYFSSAASGATRIYKRIAEAPGYRDLGDAAAQLFAETAQQHRDAAETFAENSAASAEAAAEAVGQLGAFLPGALQNGVWKPFSGMPRLRLTGTGTVTIDARNSLGTITEDVETYATTAATNQIEFPFFGDDAVEVRAAITGTLSAEII